LALNLLECTYEQPSNRRRYDLPQYVKALENQLKKAQAILKLVMPDADFDDSELEIKLRRNLSSPQSPLRAITPSTVNGRLATDQLDTDIDDHLESSTEQLDLDEQGTLEYHGHSSGLSFMRQMRESLGDVVLVEGKCTPRINILPNISSL
jgi:hypothetical protein